jgi:MFS family permease
MAGPEIGHEKRPKINLYYGYIVVAAAFFILIAYSGARSAFGVFFDPMARQFGWSAAALSTAFSISVMMDGLLGIFMGRFADRFGPRIVLTIAGCLTATGFLLMSRVTALWQMYLVYGVIAGIGMGGVFVPMITAVARWFITRRGTMNGIVLAGMGIGQLIAPPVANWLTLRLNWSGSYIVLSVVVLILIVFSAQFLRKGPSQVGRVSDNKPGSANRGTAMQPRSYALKEAVRTGRFWLIFTIFFCMGFTGFSLMVHIVPHVIDIGISASTGASILAAVGGANILGRLSMGVAADRIGNRLVSVIGFALVLMPTVWLLFIGQAWQFLVFALFFGFGQGAISSAQAPIVAELFGLKSHGLIFGCVGFGAMLGGTIGPVLMGYLFDVTASYQIAFIVCTSLAVIGVFLAIILARINLSTPFLSPQPEIS